MPNPVEQIGEQPDPNPVAIAGGSTGNTGQEPIPLESTMTEQEKNPIDDPVTPAQDSPGPVTLVNLSPREPYPTGDPPEPIEGKPHPIKDVSVGEGGSTPNEGEL